MAQSVKYDTPVKGIQYIRQISAAEWTKAGAPDQGKTVWSAENNYMVPVSELNAQALEILKNDPDMKIVGDEGGPDAVPSGDSADTAVPEGTDTTVSAGTTGRTGSTGGNTARR